MIGKDEIGKALDGIWQAVDAGHFYKAIGIVIDRLLPVLYRTYLAQLKGTGK